ncbi:MAG: hypothetical protein ACHQ5A_08395 [Opitutales bacterium]
MSIFDVIFAIGTVLSALAVAAVGLVGWLVWLAGGRQNSDWRRE